MLIYEWFEIEPNDKRNNRVEVEVISQKLSDQRSQVWKRAKEEED